jgi:hypothetical protein
MATLDDTDHRAPAAGRPPAVLDVEGYLTDPAAELRRCAAESWWAEAIDEQGRPLPLVLGFDQVRAVLRIGTCRPGRSPTT